VTSWKGLLRLFQGAAVALGLLAVPVVAHAEGPAFKVDASWPKDLPNNWVMGQVGGLSIDEQDHIWVLQRPRSLTAAEAAAAPPVKDAKPTSIICCTPAPSVLEFDQAGNLLAGWGGPVDVNLGQVDVYNGQVQPRVATAKLGYDWPATEHGILVAKGFVYLAGNGANDGMILKFKTDGTFVAEWGGVGPCTNSNDLTRFCQVADMDYDPATNEIYVADGYGNKRVAVVDADTGKIKRYWGAYGQNPVDDKTLAVDNPKSPNFGNPVHCVSLAKNGMVYVCDRNERSRPDLHQGRQVREGIRLRARDARRRVDVGHRLLLARSGPEVRDHDRRHEQPDRRLARRRWRDRRAVRPRRAPGWSVQLGALRKDRLQGQPL